jgi:glycosyltransferase involved in cell wall biosynthesis
MATGLPVLGIQSPGVGDMITDGETGYIVLEVDLAAFTAKMLRLVLEHDERRRLGRHARQAAEAYSIERTNQMMLSCYRRVIQSAAERKRNLRTRLTRLLDGWTK